MPSLRRAAAALAAAAAVAAVAVAIIGCATLPGFARKPDVRFIGMTLARMDLFSATPEFNFRVTNPNPASLSIDAITYRLRVNDRKFVNGLVDKDTRIRAGDTDVISLPVTLDFLDLFDSLSALGDAEAVSYDLSGVIAAGPFQIPFSLDGSLPLPELPEVRLRNVSVSDVTLSSASVLFELDIENTNPFAIKLNGLEYGISLGGRPFASGRIQSIPSVEAEGAATVRIPLKVNFFKLGRSVYELLKAASSMYEITGEMRFAGPRAGEARLPFRHSGRVPVK